jgi:formylglycine-generating enzyme required for sulfatase activity
MPQFGSRRARRRWIAPALVALAALLVAALVVGGATDFVRAEYERHRQARRAAAGETQLRVVNAVGASLALRRAGADLDGAASIPVGAEAWLGEGRYFLEAAKGRSRLLYPVSIDGTGEGPEPDGTWTVTVRAPPVESPPGFEPRRLGFVYIPAGPFVMGERTNPGEPHVVWVPGFHLAAFEVTNAEFRRFLADPSGYDDRASWTETGWAWRGKGSSQATARLPTSDERYSRFGRDDLPVMLVTWHEASAYCRWLTRTLGDGRWLFRMPTEAEWEKAARGPDGFDYGLGMELSEPQAALYNWRKNPHAPVTVVDVADTQRGYRANRYGVYHASGNAREWTQSLFRRMNSSHPWRDDERNDGETPGLRVTRGGSWYSASAVRLQLAYREEFQPELSSDDLGFRIAAFLGGGPGSGP